MTADQDTLDEIAARLTGHDPRQWFNPERATVPFSGMSWLVVRKDSHIEFFKTEAQAWHFKRTGVMPDDH